MSIRKRDKDYEVRWRVGSTHYSQGGFKYKKDAELFQAKQVTRIRNNTFTPPSSARITMADLSHEWLTSKEISPRTHSDYEQILASLILPVWADIRLDQVRPEAITQWVTTLKKTHSPARVRKIFTIFKQTLDYAVMAERIETNPATRANTLGGATFLPKTRQEKRHRYLTPDEVISLAEQFPEYTTMIVVMAFTGVRFGEATALQVRDVDQLRSRLLIQRAFSEVRGTLTIGPPKSGKAREIPLPRFTLDLLTDITTQATKSNDLLFKAAKGGPIRYRRWREKFDAAVNRAGIQDLKPHDLRHTYAAISAQAGVSPKALQVAMGHSDIRLTMDTYVGLFQSDIDTHGSALNAIGESAIEGTCTQNVPKTQTIGTPSMEPPRGFEPRTYALRVRCSTPEAGEKS